jgi:O-antigen/teichoic acid export membrane protein
MAIGYGIWAQWRGASDATFGDPILCFLVGVSCGAQTLGDIAKGYLRGVHSLDRMARVTALGAAGQLIATCVGSLTLGVDGAMFGYLLGAIIRVAPMRDFWLEPPELAPDLRGRIFRYAKYQWASEIAALFVFSRVEVFFLQMFWGVTSTGLLTASMLLANLAIQGPMMLTLGLLPHFSEQLARDDREGLQRSYAAATRVLGFLLLPSCFGLAAIMPELLPMMYGDAFEPAVPSAIVLIVVASLSTGTVGSSVISAMERSDVDFYFGAIGVAISVAGAFFLICPFGVMGAACSRALTQFVVVGLGAWFLGGRSGFQIPFAALSRMASCAIACAGATSVVLAIVPGLAGLLLAVASGAATYITTIRWVEALEPEDIRNLRSIADHLPLPAAPFARRLARLALG